MNVRILGQGVGIEEKQDIHTKMIQKDWTEREGLKNPRLPCPFVQPLISKATFAWLIP